MRKLLFKIARSSLAGWFIGFAFARLTKLMPLERLYEDAYGILFLHPKRYWRTHWLGVPKRAIASFAAIEWAQDGEMIIGIVQQLMRLAQPLDGHKAIVVNGGAYQDVPQLHFHMAHGGLADGGEWEQGVFVERVDGDMQLVADGYWQFSVSDCPPLDLLPVGNSAETHLITILQTAQTFVKQQQFSAYTVQLHWGTEPQASHLIAHLFAEQ